MHSRIFGIVPKDESYMNVSEDDIFDMMHGDADYVAECYAGECIEDSVEWISGYITGVIGRKFDIRDFKLSKEDIEKYFSKKLCHLKELVSSLDIETFSSTENDPVNNFDRDFILYDISRNLNEKYSFYIYSPYWGYVTTLDDFMRSFALDKEYKFMQAFDYHA